MTFTFVDIAFMWCTLYVAYCDVYSMQWMAFDL